MDPLSTASVQDNTLRNNDDKEVANSSTLSASQLFFATFKHMKKPYQLLIIPLTFWGGVEQGFFGADYTAGYISCIIGVQNVGYVFITYGVCDAICSIAFGVVTKYVGRVPIYLLGAIINVVVIVVLLYWAPDPSQAYVLYLCAALWGVADAIWQTQINAFYGIIFKNDVEAAFSNYKLWESLGFIFAYILQTQVCIHVKLWMLLAILLPGMIGYLAIELHIFRNNKL